MKTFLNVFVIILVVAFTSSCSINGSSGCETDQYDYSGEWKDENYYPRVFSYRPRHDYSRGYYNQGYNNYGYSPRPYGSGIFSQRYYGSGYREQYYRNYDRGYGYSQGGGYHNEPQRHHSSHENNDCRDGYYRPRGR